MADRHYSAEELGRYHDGLLPYEETKTVEAHIGRCAVCSEALGVIRTFDDSLRSEEVWHFADELESRRAQSALVELADRIAREDAEAEELLGTKLSTPFRFVWAKLARKRRFRTGGVVRALARASAVAREEQNPLHALNLADEAIAIAESLPEDFYPANGVYHLHGLAWKERANACRYLNRYDDALAALDRAARAYRRLLQHDVELTVVDYIRATVLWKQQRYDEALPLARSVGARYATLGEHERWVHAKILEGAILADASAPEAAREIFLVLADQVSADGDPITRARIELGLANVYLDEGDLGTAARYYQIALRRFETLGIETEAARVRWSIGTLALHSGAHVEAARLLAAARDEINALGMPGDAALVGLDLCEALLLLGRTEPLRQLASEIVEHAKQAAMLPAALTAMAYLREAADLGRLTAADITHVRRFVHHLEGKPTLRFEPPPQARNN